MKRFVYLLIALSFVIGITLGSSTNVLGQAVTIPGWVKNTALWWGQGQISDSDFIKALQYLIDHGYLKISSNTQTASSNSLSIQDAKTNQSILDGMDNCTKVTSDTDLKKCIYIAKDMVNLCNQMGQSQLPACTDSRLLKFSQEPEPSPFSDTTCNQDQFGIVKMNGQFTNGGTAYSSIMLKLGVLDDNDNVVATGTGFVSNIQPYETKIFDAEASYSGQFKSCQIQIDLKLP